MNLSQQMLNYEDISEDLLDEQVQSSHVRTSTNIATNMEKKSENFCMELKSSNNTPMLFHILCNDNKDKSDFLQETHNQRTNFETASAPRDIITRSDNGFKRDNTLKVENLRKMTTRKRSSLNLIKKAKSEEGSNKSSLRKDISHLLKVCVNIRKLEEAKKCTPVKIMKNASVDDQYPTMKDLVAPSVRF